MLARLATIRTWLERGIDHPWRIMAGALVVALIAVAMLSRVRFEANYSALLPEDSPIVQEFRAVQEKLGGGTSDLIVELRGPEDQRLAVARELADALAPDPRFAWVDFAIDSRFFADRALYAVPFDDLRKLADTVQTAYQTSLGQAMTGLDLDDLDDDDDEQDPENAESDPWQPVREIRDRLTERADSLRARYAPTDDQVLHVFIRPRIASAELARVRECFDTVRAAVAAIDPAARGLEVQYSGRLAIHLAEQQATSEDLGRATGVALLLVVLITALIARRATGPIVIAIPLILSLAITLAASTVLVDQLNLISAFMMPALVGLGIDFGIHLYLRFLVELRRGRASRPAIREAIQATVGASSTSALTTAGAFFALAAVDFRGFRELGLLGGSGVLVTFITTYTLLPALAVVLTRKSARADTGSDAPSPIERLGARLATASRTIALVIAALALVAGIWAGWQLPRTSFENDFGKLKGTAPAIERTERIEAELGLILSPAVIMVPDLATARHVEQVALTMRDEAGEPTEGWPDRPIAIREALSIARLLPDRGTSRVSRRRAMLESMADTLDKVVGFGKLSRDDERAVDELIRLARAEPWTLQDIPAAIRRRLMASDGSGHFVFVWPNSRLYRDRIMQGWLGVMDDLIARSRASSPSPATIQLLDERRLPLEVMELVRRDLPTAFALASLLVVLVLVLHCRRVLPVLLISGAMALAVVVTVAVLVVTDIQLNVYNAVLLPCIVGIGIDNAIHIQHAHHRAGPGSLPWVLATTGVSVFLASLTTAIGFGASITARQGGLQAMGTTALIGAGCAFVASTIVLPALLHLLEKKAEM